MIAQEMIHSLYGRAVYDRDGDKIGTIDSVWSDGVGQPTWASVRTGMFGLNESLIPLQAADVQDDRLVLRFDKATVKDAPNIDASHDEPLTQDEVDRLYQHYGMSWDDSYRAYQSGAAASNASYQSGAAAGSASSAGVEAAGRGGAGRGGASRGGAGRDADDAMTRSEERLTVDTRREQVGRARLRKYVVTEQQQVTVPVSHEEVRLEREPITEANRAAAYSGPDITESEYEVTLHAERPVVATETVPVERVRLGKETVTDQEAVTGEVRKERIEAELPDGRGRRDID